MNSADLIRQLQRALGVAEDGIYGPATHSAALALTRGRPIASDLPAETVAMATKHLRFEEGCVAYAYQDHLGYWTIGVGRLIDKRKGGALSDCEIDTLLANDIAARAIAMRDWPAWRAVKDDPVRAVALIGMAFQLGIDGLAAFKNSLALIAARRWKEAADNLLLSKWAGQTPARAKRVARMIETGQW